MLYSISHQQWQADRDDQAAAALEMGNIVYFPNLAFALLPEEMPLISSRLADGLAKNISFNSQTQTLKGIAGNALETHAINNLMQRYAQYSTQLLQTLIPQYTQALQIGRTSLRLVEIAGRRAASYKKDDTRLHVDAFPASPTQGLRILRVFCNINPNGKPRLWHVGESFEKVAATFLPRIRRSVPGSARLLHALKITKSRRSYYDHIMLHMHDGMKKDMCYQKSVQHTEIAFPPASTWMVYTDQVSHAALAGQHLLEQTFYLPVHVMQEPARSPLRVLEKMTNTQLVQ